MMLKLKLSLAVAAALSLGAAVQAAELPQPAASTQSAPSKTDMTEGEIKKVNKDTGKITIKHGELKNLDMPPMTMVFQVKDKSMLEQVQAGDKILFIADRIDGKYTVTQLETAK